jgi:hypothetical protein
LRPRQSQMQPHPVAAHPRGRSQPVGSRSDSRHTSRVNTQEAR